MLKQRFVIFTAFLIVSVTFAQVEYEKSPPDYIKTVIFRGSNSLQSELPLVELGDNLFLQFDALNGNEDDFYYKIEHYNYDWTPSQLMKTEYMNGFDNQRIRNYENSFNTYQIYSHYMLQLPNKFTRGLNVSGNYMIKIFNDLDELVFSRKFMVYENLSNVGVLVRQSRNVKFFDEKQTVDIVINSGAIEFNNPLETVKTLIIQNNNVNTAISNIGPQYTIGKELIYKYNNETSFYAGNEYFFFENKDLRAATSTIQFISLADLYNTFLFANVPRANLVYTYNPDINGNFVVTAIDVERPYIEADYAWVHFALAMDEPIPGKSVHVYGNFNNYVIEESTKMEFNTDRNFYETSLLLKQGFYNYKYVVIDNATGKLDEGAISGNFWQTENDYKVIVYYRNLGARYDRIVGYGNASSIDMTN